MKKKKKNKCRLLDGILRSGFRKSKIGSVAGSMIGECNLREDDEEDYDDDKDDDVEIIESERQLTR